MWGNPMREREVYYSASGKYISAAKQHFQPRKYLTTPNLSYRNLPRFPCQNRIVVLSSIPRFSCPHSIVRIVLYGPKTAIENMKIASKIVPKNFLDFRAKSVRMYGLYRIVRTVRIRIVRPPTAKKNSAKNHRNFFLGIVPTFLKKCALFVVHFFLSSLLIKSL
jgi:hypothetical protein